MTKPLFFLAFVILVMFTPSRAPAETPAASTTTAITPAQAQQAIDALQDPGKREQLIAVLKAIAAAAPVIAPAPDADTAPATPVTGVALQPNSLGAQLLVALSHWSTRLAGEVAAMARATANMPALWRWLTGIATDPAASRSLLIAAIWVAAIVGGALILELATALALRRPRRALTEHLPAANGDNIRLLRLLPFVLIRLLLDLVPVGVFAATGICSPRRSP